MNVRIDYNGDGWWELRINGRHFNFFEIEGTQIRWAKMSRAEYVAWLKTITATEATAETFKPEDPS